MKYSIIIPVYNSEKTLGRCIESIINQSYEDYEIILVNDGSKDDSLKICLEYSKKYENIITVNQPNGGASSARNKGLETARGDFVLFVDSDDYVSDNYFGEFEKYDAHGGWVIFKDSWEVNHRIITKQIRDNFAEEDLFVVAKYLIASRMVNSPCAKIFDREIIEKHALRFNANLLVAEDFEFGLRYLFLCSKIKIVNVSVYIYNATSQDSLVRKKKENLIDIYPKVFDSAFNSIAASNFSSEEKMQLCKICDMQHVESFGTCVMEEFKDIYKTPKEIKKEISDMCEKFNSRYYKNYGYCNIVHFVMRLCIKNKWSNTLYILGKLYVLYRNRGIK